MLFLFSIVFCRWVVTASRKPYLFAASAASLCILIYLFVLRGFLPIILLALLYKLLKAFLFWFLSPFNASAISNWAEFRAVEEASPSLYTSFRPSVCAIRRLSSVLVFYLFLGPASQHTTHNSINLFSSCSARAVAVTFFSLRWKYFYLITDSHPCTLHIRDSTSQKVAIFKMCCRGKVYSRLYITSIVIFVKGEMPLASVVL